MSEERERTAARAAGNAERAMHGKMRKEGRYGWAAGQAKPGRESGERPGQILGLG